MTAHPAKFSNPILGVIGDYLAPGWRVLDPFAGTGRIHTIPGIESWGVELEPEWASMHPRTLVGDALELPFRDHSFDAIATSPCYGNRMADHHHARDGSRRLTYRHTLGRALHPSNAGQLQWGPAYRTFHVAAWREALRVLRPGGTFIINIKNHVRRGVVQDVAAFHAGTLIGLNCQFADVTMIPAPGMRFGENGTSRLDQEMVVVFTSSTAAACTQRTLQEADVR